MISGIHIASSEMVIRNTDTSKSKLPAFTKNQVLHARVLSLLSPGNAQLLINGQKVIARTHLLLKPGEEVQLKVLEQKDAVVLKLINPVQKMTLSPMSALLGFFSKNESLPDISKTRIPGLKTLLHGLALKSDTPDANFLPKLVENSGMVWEKKLAQLLLGKTALDNVWSGFERLSSQDIKGTILNALFTADPQSMDTMKTAAAYSETLEHFQLLNHHSAESGRYLLPFPIFSDQAFSFGQLLVDTGDKKSHDPNDPDTVVRISFLLNMTRLGPLRADFSILKKQITGQFLLSDEETCDYVKSRIPDLKDRLSLIDYHVQKIDCLIDSKSSIQENTFIETLLNLDQNQVLNIVV